MQLENNMKLVLDPTEELALLTPEQAAKLMNIGRDKILELFGKGEIKTIVTAKAVNKETGTVREYRRTKIEWLRDWQEKMAEVTQPRQTKIYRLNKRPIKTKYPVGMKTSEYMRLQTI